MPNRMEKIDEIVKREVAKSLLELLPDQIISVTAVQVSKDLSFAKIWVTALNDIENIVGECQKHAANITHNLARRLTIKRVPKLLFLADKSTERVDRVEELLREIHNNKQ